MTSGIRHIAIAPAFLVFVVGLASCQLAVPAAVNNQRETTVTLVCDAPGLSSEEVESTVTVPLETALNGIEGVQQISSVSRPAQAVIRLTFPPGAGTLRARQIVAEQINAVSLPENSKVSLAPASLDEMFLIAMRDDTPVETAQEIKEQAGRLRDLAENSLRRQLLTVTRVSAVVVVGGRRKQYQVFPDADKLAAFNITPSELATAIRRANTAVGELPLTANDEILVRGFGQIQALEHIVDTAVRTSPDGALVRVKDVAGVRIGWISGSEHKEGEADQIDPNDAQAVILAVQLQPAADKTAVNNKIDEVLEQIQQELPPGVKTQRKFDRTLDQLARNLIDKLRRGFPPEVQLQRRSSKQFGDILAIAPSQRITVKLYGPDLAVLRQKAIEIREAMEGVPGVVDLQVHPQPNVPQMNIEIDHDMAARIGVTAKQVADAVSMAMGDHVVSKIRERDRQYECVMKRTDEARQIAQTPIRTQSGALVPVNSVANITRSAIPRAVYRDNGHRVFFISCDVKDRTRSDVEADIKKSLGPLPRGYFVGIIH